MRTESQLELTELEAIFDYLTICHDSSPLLGRIDKAEIIRLRGAVRELIEQEELG